MRELTKKAITNFSKTKKESKKVLDSRLSSLNRFLECPNPIFGPDLKLDYDSFKYFHETDSNINKIETEELIICDMHMALVDYKDIIDNYLDKLIIEDETKFTLLNSTIWNNGLFVYIYPNKKVNIPFEKTNFSKNLIIVGESSELTYINIENSTIDMQNSVDEVFVLENAICKYITLQTCLTNTYNFSTKRFQVEKNGILDFINISIGSKINMSYPSILLKENANTSINSLLIATREQILDEGIRITHVDETTSSTVFCNNIAYAGGEANYREFITIKKDAINSKSNIRGNCNILDFDSRGDIISKNIIENELSSINNTSVYDNFSIFKFNKIKYIKDFISNINLELDKDLIKYLKRLLMEKNY